MQEVIIVRSDKNLDRTSGKLFRSKFLTQKMLTSQNGVINKINVPFRRLHKLKWPKQQLNQIGGICLEEHLFQNS